MSYMKEILILMGAAFAIAGLIIFQLKVLKKNHPNAELLISLLKNLNANKNTAGDDSNAR